MFGGAEIAENDGESEEERTKDVGRAMSSET